VTSLLKPTTHRRNGTGSREAEEEVRRVLFKLNVQIVRSAGLFVHGVSENLRFSARIRWDEETISKHDEDRGTRQKVSRCK
jgi:hypothetical protein